MTRGDRAGFAEVSGKRLLDFRPASTLDLGRGGTLLLDPDAIFVGTTNPGGGVSFFDVATLQTQLATTNVVLNSSTSAGDITFGAPLTWNAATSLTAKAGGSINVNASITASHADSALIFRAGREATSGIQGNPALNPRLTSAVGTTITAGTLSYGANADSAIPDYTTSPRTASADFNGNLNVGTLQVDLSGGATGIGTFGSNNQLGAFRTTGTGDLTFAYIADHGGNLGVKLASANSSAPQVQITTPGTLTLESGTSFNFASQANLILASTGGAFVNQAGATPFGANTRSLIYTSTPAATTRGSLSPTYVFNQSFNSADPLGGFGGDTTSRLIYSGSKATVTLTADNQTRVYGDTNAAPTFTATGLVDGDTFATSGITGAPALAHTATQLSNVGSHGITAATGTLAASSFYNVTTASGALSITPAPLSIALDNQSRTYGDANPALTASFTGLKNGELPASAGTLSVSTTATQSSNAGTYAITGSLGSANPNYTATIAPGTLTIDKAALTVSVSNSISKAQGAANPDFTAFTSATGLKLSDTLAIAVPNLAFNTTATTSSPDGTYAVTPTGTSANYALTFNPGLLTISTVVLPALSYRANDATRVYGDANPAFGFTRTGLLGGTPDDVTGAPAFSTTATQSSGVGSYAINISQGTLASSNYRFTFIPGSLSITPAPLTVTMGNAARAYGDGNPNFASSVTGLKNSDTALAAGTVAPSTSATPTSNVGTYAIGATLSGTSANYTATVVPGTLTVNQAALTATINNASRAPNTANPSFSATYSGFKNGETASVISGLAFATTATLASPSGAYPITGSGTATNYALTFIPGTLTIGSTLNYAATSFGRIYGDANPSSLPYTVTGLLPGDTLVTVTTGAPALSTAATQSSGVGSYTIAIAQGTLASPSYAFTFTPGTLSITPAPLTITANNASRNLNHANPAFTASYTGFKNSDTSTVVSGLQFATTATLASPTGSYPITPSGATAANYAITYVPGTLNIGGLAALTIGANNASKTYGQPNPAFTASYSGLVNGDTASVVSGLQFSTTATQASGVGSYTITPFGASATGYSISYVPGTLTIDRATLFVAPQAASRVYGDANPAFNATFSGLVNGDTSSVVSGLSFNTPATQASNAGVYPISLSGGSAANYNVVTSGTASLTVNPAPLTVRFDDKTRVYGDANPALTFNISGLKNSDTADSAVRVTNVSSTAAPTDGIGDYGINGLVLPNSSNYDVKGVGGTMRITPRPLTISADPKTKVYGDANPALTATFSGLASFDTPAAIPGVTLRTEATQASGVSDFGILVSSGLNRNYAINYKFGTLSITPASLSLLAPPDVARTYGRADPALPALNFGGLKNGDSLAGLRARYVDVPAPTADVGTYTYGVAIDNPNYRLTGPTTASFRVDPAPLDVQIGSTGRTYGDANPSSYTINAAGLAFGQTVGSVLRVVNDTDDRTGVGVYTLRAEATSPNYYVNSTTDGRFQINPRLLQFDIGNLARYYGDLDPDFAYTFGREGLAPSDNITAIISGFKTAVPVTRATDVGLYRIDPIFKANPNYLVSWTPGYLAIVPRPITLTVNNAIAFGNDNVPAGFTTAGTGVDLVRDFRSGDPSFTVTATNLPANIRIEDVYPHLRFTTSLTNEPQRVVTAIDLDTVFGPRPAPTAPQATTDGVSTAAFVTGSLPSAAITTSEIIAEFKTEVLVVIDGKLIKNPSAAQAVLDRFADQILYVSPAGHANGNYAVTGITNGVLTLKADPDVVRINMEVALRKEQREKAQTQFEHGGRTGAFGLPPELFGMLRELLGFALNEALKSGDVGPDSLYFQINGGPGNIFTGDRAQEDKFLFWLADIHVNALKQAQLLPTLLEYAMNAAGRKPEQRSKMDNALVAHMTPFIQKAQEDFANQLKAEKAAWLKKQESAEGATMFMLGMTDMYTEVITNSVINVTKSTTDKVSTEVKKLVEEAKTTLDELKDDPYAEAKTTLKYSANVGLAGLAATASMAATKQYLSDTHEGIGSLARKDSIKGQVDNLFKNNKALENAFKNITDEASDGLGLDRLRERASQAVEDTVAKTLKSDKAVQRLQDTYEKAFKEALDGGATKEAAEKLAMEATQKETAKIAERAAKNSIENMSDYIATHASKVAEHVRSPAVQNVAEEAAQKAYQETLDRSLQAIKDNGETLTGKEVLDKTDSAKKLAQKAADEAKQKVLLEAEESFSKKVFQESGDKAASKVGAELAEEGVEKAGTKLAGELGEDAITKLATELGGEGAEKLASKLGAKALGKVSEEAVSKAATLGSKAAAKMAVEGVEIGVKAAKLTTKIASMTKSLFLGPMAIVELAVEVAVQAGSSAIERADQENRLNALIADGSKPVDVQAMATDQNGRAIMMMGLLKMFSAEDPGK